MIIPYVLIIQLLLFNDSDLNQQNRKNKKPIFEVTYHEFNQEAEEAFEKAIEIWEKHIVTQTPIRINAFFSQLEGAKGITIPNGILNFQNSPIPGTWYPSSLADAISGRDLQPGFSDMDIYINSDSDWYLGSDRKNPPYKYELVSVAMHEIGHGLGIISLADIDDEKGSFSLQTIDDLFMPISFPMPELNGEPIIFDRFITDQSKRYLVNIENPSIELMEFFISGEIWFFGPETIKNNQGNAPEIESGRTFRRGSSIAHFAENYFEPNNDDALMTPSIGRGEVIKKPGPVTLGVLKDLGWKIK